MVTEIGARDLGDQQRYNMLEVSGIGSHAGSCLGYKRNLRDRKGIIQWSNENIKSVSLSFFFFKKDKLKITKSQPANFPTKHWALEKKYYGSRTSYKGPQCSAYV